MLNFIYILVILASIIIAYPISEIAKSRNNYIEALKPNRLFNKSNISFKFINSITYSLCTSNLYLKIFSQEITLEKIVIFCVFSVIIYFFLFIAIYDIYYFEIPNNSTNIFLIILVLLNLGLFFTQGRNFNIEIFEGTYFIPYSNLIAGSVAAAFIAIFVIGTRGKGMGAGDIFIAGIIGLIVGTKGLIVAFYITVLIGLVISLSIAYKERKFRGVQIPFVPFMSAGAIIAILFSTQIIDTILSIL